MRYTGGYELEELPAILRHIHVMRRFFGEVIDASPEYRKHYADLHVAYMDILNEELAPFALLLALSLAEFEDQLQQRLI